jgi:hypothetical protein
MLESTSVLAVIPKFIADVGFVILGSAARVYSALGIPKTLIRRAEPVRRQARLECLKDKSPVIYSVAEQAQFISEGTTLSHVRTLEVA